MKTYRALVVLFCGLVATVAVANGNQIEEKRLGEGTTWATHYYVRDSGQPGPTVMIIGGLHGNEPAGAVAAAQIRHWPIQRGKLVILPRANQRALKVDRRFTPDVAKELRDLNRNFPRKQTSETPRGPLATAIWKVVQETSPDWLLDLQEGRDFRKVTDKSVGSSVIAHPNRPTLAASAKILATINATVDNPDKQFVQLKYPIDSGLARAAAEHLACNSLTLETTTKGQSTAFRARQQRVMAHACLSHLKMVTSTQLVNQVLPTGDADSLVHVALYDDAGNLGPGVSKILNIGSSSSRMLIERVCAEDVCAGVLGSFDVVIFSGGTGSGQSKALKEDGRQRVVDFVKQGGGYVGICAGAYLACEGFSWGLGILDAKTASPKWRRGAGMVQIELSRLGQQLLGNAKQKEVRYVNGPILVPANAAMIPAFRVLGSFRSELAKNGTPPGIMLGSPAIVAGEFGEGRVICFSPHPEQTEGLAHQVTQAVEWVNGD